MAVFMMLRLYWYTPRIIAEASGLRNEKTRLIGLMNNVDISYHFIGKAMLRDSLQTLLYLFAMSVLTLGACCACEYCRKFCRGVVRLYERLACSIVEVPLSRWAVPRRYVRARTRNANANANATQTQTHTDEEGVAQPTPCSCSSARLGPTRIWT